jgi:L-serine dehydratase
MSYSLFDIVGPIMHGPSSNHTGGANRIGYVAYRLMGGTPKQLTFGFHPIFMRMFTGHRTHIAMLAGCLGLREFDDACNDSKRLAAEQGVTVSYIPLQEQPEVDRNTMRILGDYDGISWSINGISIGGGNIVISSINGVEVHIDGNHDLLFFILKECAELETLLPALGRITGSEMVEGGCAGGYKLAAIQTSERVPEDTMAEIRAFLGDCLVAERWVEPMHDFAQRSSEPPLFQSFEELMALAQERPILDVVIDYECRRSQRTPQQVMDMALRIVDVIDRSMQQGLKGNNQLIGGFCSGNDGKMAYEWGENEHSITGPVFNRAMARALAMSEINATAGLVVAVPTAGSAGGLPGTLFTVAERYGKNKEALAGAFLIAAAVGAIIGNNHASFSGSIGGCQAEVGIGAGMAAAGSVWLAGGSPEAICHACALAIKNLLGLVCDPLAGPVEIPCIKRNAVGASTALMGAELALAGVRSAVPPDQVTLALIDVQQRLPHALRGACTGGLAACPIAKDYQKQWADKLASDQNL